jgi:hypothetical protein
MVTLHAVLFRRADLTHDQFLDYWHNVHGPHSTPVSRRRAGSDVTSPTA